MTEATLQPGEIMQMLYSHKWNLSYLNVNADVPTAEFEHDHAMNPDGTFYSCLMNVHGFIWIIDYFNLNVWHPKSCSDIFFMIHSHFSREAIWSAYIRMTVALFYIQGLKIIQSVPLVSRINIQESAS